MSLLQSIRFNFGNATRLKDWRYSFIPQIFGNLYLWLVLFNIGFGAPGVVLLFCSLVTSFGFAALGYFINEFFDQQDDARAGKLNKLSLLNNLQKAMLFIVICLVTSLPWVFLEYNTVSLSLIALQVLLFVLYASPPFRFKKINYLSVITDSLYAYVVPLLLSMNTYYLSGSNDKKDFLFIIPYALLMFITGLRNIMIHYINDIFRDKRIGFYTLPRVLGVHKSNTMLKVCIFLELILVAIVYARLAFFFAPFVVLFLPFIFLLTRLAKQWKKVNKGMIVFNPVRHIPDLLFQHYQPLFLLIPLLFFDWHWWGIVPVHLLLFIPLFRYHPIISWFKRINWKKYAIFIRQLLSWVVNYTIFYCFLLVGVNLRKRNQSAFSFLKQKFSNG